MIPDRMVALNILKSILIKGQSLQVVISGDNCSKYAKFLIYGVLRHYFSLKKMLSFLVKKSPKKDIELILLTGLYELWFLDKPPYAVLSEWVTMSGKQHMSAKGFVNGVLRTFVREKETYLSKFKTFESSISPLPAWLTKHIQTIWPDYYVAIFNAFVSKPPLTLRIEKHVMSRESYLEKLAEKDITAVKTPLSSYGVMIHDGMMVNDLPGFLEGWGSVQDEGAQLSSLFYRLPPYGKVLDACAAPGGKTTHMIAIEPTIVCTAMDIDANRLKKVADNLNRLHMKATLKVGDASCIDNFPIGEAYDFILLDAPCSATGIIRRQPDVKFHRTPADMKALSDLQQRLLNALWPYVKSNGYLLYMTCSILSEENEQQIKDFSAKHPDLQFESCDVPSEFLSMNGFGYQLLPKAGYHDGFFYSLMKKVDKK
jgi:16S rRNA (cytosine967-C5)-methyltransferase